MTSLLSVHVLPPRDWFGRAWSWWTVELRAMMPGSLRHRPDGHTHSDCWLRVAPDGLTLGLVRKGRLSIQSLEATPQPRSVMTIDAQGSLRLDPALVFETTLTFPRQAEANLRQIVGNHLGLLIPMDPAELAFDLVVLKRDPVAQTLLVAAAVTKRATLDRARKAAAQAGFSPTAAVIDRGGEIDGRFDLMRHERRPSSATGGRFWLRALEAAILLLVLATAGVQFYRMDTGQTQVASRIAQLRTEAATVMQLQRKAQQLAESAAALRARRDAASPLQILAAMTRLLPDDTWVSFVHVQDRTVEMVGNSRHAASLIGLFEQAAGFQAPRFLSPVTTNPDGSEHFDLAVTIRSPPP